MASTVNIFGMNQDKPSEKNNAFKFREYVNVVTQIKICYV